MQGPLSGIKVLDMSRYIAGPHCGMLLGDLGADVIKIERRGKGEDSRGQGPFKTNGDQSVSLYFTQYNKNKRSLAIDFYNPKSIELLKKLIAKSDVLLENFRPGTLAKMGLSPACLLELNPKLVITSISGFGQEGAYRDRAAFDCIGQAFGGLMGISGEENGQPLMSGTWVGDFVTALYAAYGTVSAVYYAKNTGVGQQLDISLVECVTSILATAVPNYAANRVIQKPRGNRDNVCAPANLFHCKDGDVYFHGGTDPLFKRLTALMGQTELLDDPRFCNVPMRMENYAAIEEIVQNWVGRYTRDEAEQLLVGAGIPFGKISTVKDIVENPFFKERGAIIYQDYPGIGEIALPGIVVKMSKTPGGVRLRPPMTGEHNADILSEYLGMSQEEIQALEQEKII